MSAYNQWSCRTIVRVGHGASAACLGRAGLGRRPFLVADAGLAAHIDQALSAVVPDRVLQVPANWRGIDAVRALADEFAQAQPTAVVGLGGGSVLDLVKLASAASLDPRILPVLRSRANRGGLIVLPDAGWVAPRLRSMTLVCIPTTVGTGVEVSSVACLPTPFGKRLVTGDQLRPDLAVLDSAHTATLPPELLREGVLEALMRVLGTAVGSSAGHRRADGEAAGLVAELVSLGEELVGRKGDAAVRLAVAQSSAATHTGWSLVGRPPFAARHWYLANELSTVLGVRKMTATAAVVPAVWERICAGDDRLGNAERQRVAWSWVRAAAPRLPDEPVLGIRALLRNWAVGAPLSATDAELDLAAQRAHTSWGGRLPMLAGLSFEEIRSLYTQAVRYPAASELEVCP
ncbi:daptide-type RiPP biosynthesis dehydogenase [Streptomyces sp. NPDC093707]|uniref:daptide-type RiPP biosynthesis dehydogenase n=1 Tax=Streptomyces sp. NPDC093707 TaxID=3154984 RepID=UPI00344D489A